MKVPRAILASLVMNGASALLGVVLIPIVGVVWEIFPGLILSRVFKVGTFNPGTWVGTFVLAVLINTVVELSVLRLLFRVSWCRRNFWTLSVANVASVAIACASFIVRPLTW